THIQNASCVVRRTDGCAVGPRSYDLTAVANLGAADLLVCVRHRDLLRLQHLQLQTWSAQNPWRDRLVTRSENCGGDLDCIRLARLDPVAGALSNRLHSRPSRHRHWCRWFRARVESGRAAKFGCASFRSYTCPALDDGNARRERKIAIAPISPSER